MPFLEKKTDSLIRDKKALAADILGTGAGAARALTEMTDDDLLRFVSLDLRSEE